MEVEHHLFCILNLLSFKFQNSREMIGNVAQTIIEDEGAMENQRWCG